MAEKLQLENRAISKVREGLNALSGVSDKASEITRFDFDGKLVWNIAKNEDLFERAENIFLRARKALAAKHQVVEGMKLTDENAPRVALYQKELDELQDKTQELTGVLKLKRSDLEAAGVKIPSVFKCLMPILTDS